MFIVNIKFLLLLIPIALGLDWFGADPILIFLASGLAIVPLTVLIGDATEHLAVRLGPTLGGLLNGTMGNVPEIIISVSALVKGLDIAVVKASLTGTLLSNVLLVLGLSILAGGVRFSTLRYNVAFAGVTSKLLLLATVGLIVPALFRFTTDAEYTISVEIAVILFLAYLASLAFTLVTHRQLFAGKQAESPLETGRHAWGLGRALTVLAVSAVGLAIMSEVLTGALEPTADRLGFSPTFAGIFLLASVGNISELINAILFARKDKMDLTLAVTLGASTQVALLVAPVLVFAGLLMGRPMDLLFSRFEVVAIAIAVIIVERMTADGESHWIEGVLLVAVYLMLGVGFYYLPSPLPVR